MLKIEENDLELMPFPSPWGSGRWSYIGVPFTGTSFEYWGNHYSIKTSKLKMLVITF